MSERIVWREGKILWAIILGTMILLGFVFIDAIKEMVRVWETREEYSYGYMIPFITLFLIWQRKDRLEQVPFNGAWAGIFVVLFGVLLAVLGDLSTIYVIVQYALLIVLIGMALSLAGSGGSHLIIVPLLFLIFMIPLPVFIYNILSGQLQLLSSQLGVAVIRLLGISVHLEGNVIDLGIYKLQVVEACNGLRYLFPLASLAFISAYFFKVSFWKRAVIVLSSIPITVLMNSFRIGAIGVLVDRWGTEMAEGFLHDFEGWVVFMACIAVLVLEMWVLSRVGEGQRPWRDVFGLEFPQATPADAIVKVRSVPRPFMASLGILVLTAVLVSMLGQRVEVAPQRADFSGFPRTIDAWKGIPQRLESIYVDALKFDDYILADYTDDKGQRVNLYVAYYASQRKGESVHSPRSCIPGGGWEITSLSQRRVENVVLAKQPLMVNRAVIQKGEDKHVVYYWFQQRGRIITNEYLAKWYLFWDALTRNRTDGALVRLVTDAKPGQADDADSRLAGFANAISKDLNNHIPE